MDKWSLLGASSGVEQPAPKCTGAISVAITPPEMGPGLDVGAMTAKDGTFLVTYLCLVAFSFAPFTLTVVV